LLRQIASFFFIVFVELVLDRGSVSCLDPAANCSGRNIHAEEESEDSPLKPAPFPQFGPVSSIGVRKAWRRQPRKGWPFYIRDLLLLNLVINISSILYLKLLFHCKSLHQFNCTYCTDYVVFILTTLFLSVK
jgi:hypothetical protein